MSDSGDDLELRIRPDALDKTAGVCDKLRIVGPGDDEYGHVEFVDPSPEWRLGSGSGVPETRGETGGSVLSPQFGQRYVNAERGKHRLSEPLVDERLDADVFDVGGESVVGSTAQGAFGSIVDSRGRADEDEALDKLGMSEGDVQGESPAHRIAEVCPSTTGSRQKICAFDKIGHHRGRVSMAGSVDQHQLVVDGEILGERPPAGPGLREPVDHDDRRTRPANRQPWTGIGIVFHVGSVGPVPAKAHRLRTCLPPGTK